MPKNYLISEELCDKILTYLSHQPYRDVFQLMAQIQNLREEFDHTLGREKAIADFVVHKDLWQEFLKYERANPDDPNWVEEIRA